MPSVITDVYDPPSNPNSPDALPTRIRLAALRAGFSPDRLQGVTHGVTIAPAQLELICTARQVVR